MYILTVCHTETIARYFVNVNYEIEELHPNVNFIYVCSYPSAHRYLKQKGKQSILLPRIIHSSVKKENHEVIETNKYRGMDLDELIYFHKEIQENPNKNTGLLKGTAKRYLDFFNKLFDEYNINKILVWGEGRLITDIPVKLGKKKELEIFHFEQGPFQTIMFDRKGINFNSSFRNVDRNAEHIDFKSIDDFINRKKSPKYYTENKNRYLNKIQDFIWMAPPKFLRRNIPIDTQTFESFTDKFLEGINRVIPKKRENHSIVPTGKNLLLALQVPADAQMILHSPNYKTFFEMAQDIHQSLPKGYNLVIKEHPLYQGKYDENLYTLINEKDNIKLVNNIELNKLLDNVELVIVNNSTLGLEALTQYKKVVTLGDAFYNKEGVVWNYDRNKHDLKRLLIHVLNSKVDKESMALFLYNLFYDYLIDDHHKNDTFYSAKYVASKIMAES